MRNELHIFGICNVLIKNRILYDTFYAPINKNNFAVVYCNRTKRGKKRKRGESGRVLCLKFIFTRMRRKSHLLVVLYI